MQISKNVIALVRAFASSLAKQVEQQFAVKPHLYIDKHALAISVEEVSNKIGAIDTKGGLRFLENVTQRISRHFGKRYAKYFGLPAQMLADCMFFHIVTELSVLLPTRHAARRIACKSKGGLIIIELPSLTENYLKFWESNALEPLYLYTELKRRGENAWLCVSEPADSHSILGGLNTSMRLEPTPVWKNMSCPELHERSKTRCHRAIVTAGMRGVKDIIAEIGDTHFIACDWSLFPHFTDTIYPKNKVPPQIEIPVQLSTPFAVRTPNGIRRLRVVKFGAEMRRNLLDYLAFILGDLVVTMAANAEHLIQSEEINELHVCDHYFLEAAVMSHVVKAQGGKISLWPHSASPSHYNLRSDQMDAIHCVTKSGIQLWRKQFPSKPIALRPNLMLPERPLARRQDPEKKLTVVVVGGAHCLGRMPLLNVRSHCRSYKSFFQGLEGMEALVDIKFRPKAPWEDEVWLRRIVGETVKFEVIKTLPSHIDLPNMIYVSVTLASTAILEAIGRGCIGLIVRDCDVEDYIRIDPRAVPTAATEEILAEISRCTDPEYRENLLKQQRDWYLGEVGIKDYVPPLVASYRYGNYKGRG